MDNKNSTKTIDNVYADFDDHLNISVIVDGSGFRSKIGINYLFRDQLRKHDGDRKKFINEIMKDLNGAIDEIETL